MIVMLLFNTDRPATDQKLSSTKEAIAPKSRSDEHADSDGRTKVMIDAKRKRMLTEFEFRIRLDARVHVSAYVQSTQLMQFASMYFLCFQANYV